VSQDVQAFKEKVSFCKLMPCTSTPLSEKAKLLPPLRINPFQSCIVAKITAPPEGRRSRPPCQSCVRTLGTHLGLCISALPDVLLCWIFVEESFIYIIAEGLSRETVGLMGLLMECTRGSCTGSAKKVGAWRDQLLQMKKRRSLACMRRRNVIPSHHGRSWEEKHTA
jgi:hypothetical protein